METTARAQHTYGGDLFTTDCKDDRHAWRATDDELWRACKWCDARQPMMCGDCGGVGEHTSTCDA